MNEVKIPAKGNIIKMENKILKVPDNPIIPFIEGDGIGRDIWKASVKVINAAIFKAYNGDKKIEWLEVYAGKKANDVYKQDIWLPQETLDLIDKYLVAIKGPLTTPVGGGIRSINVALRQKLDLYVCQRPVRWFENVPCPIKKPQDVNMTIFRENTEGIYAGIEFEEGSEDVELLKKLLRENFNNRFQKIRFPNSVGIGIKPISREGSKRLIFDAIQYAIDQKQKSVTFVHKGNIMKFTEGAFKQWGYELANNRFKESVFTWAQYDLLAKEKGQNYADSAQDEAIKSGKVIIKDVIADAFLQQILTRPKEYDVISTMNLNGDYISDALAAQVGGIGLAPGANINYQTGLAIFEATHGTAPKYAGLDKVNPSSVILSGEMMLRYMGWDDAANLIINSIDMTMKQKKVTYDLARQMNDAILLKCSEFGDTLVQNM